MKNDYLWDKTGNDAEIEKLENALQIFRHSESEAPQISNNVISFKKQSPRKVFPVFRALAASFVFAFVLIGIWFYSDSEIEFANHETADSLPNEISANPKTSDFIQPEKTGIETGLSDDKFENKPEKQNYKIQKLIYKPKAKRQKIQKNQIVKLTAEEKAAYEKLMLALSITGSKLKIVKDKVQNLDEQTAINTENNIDTRKK